MMRRQGFVFGKGLRCAAGHRLRVSIGGVDTAVVWCEHRDPETHRSCNLAVYVAVVRYQDAAWVVDVGPEELARIQRDKMTPGAVLAWLGAPRFEAGE